MDPFEWCEVDRALAFVAVAPVFRVFAAAQQSFHAEAHTSSAFVFKWYAGTHGLATHRFRLEPCARFS